MYYLKILPNYVKQRKASAPLLFIAIFLSENLKVTYIT